MKETMICTVCEQEKPAQRGGRCKACVCRSINTPVRYVWTADIEAQLRRAYKAKRKSGTTRMIDELVARTGWPRHVFNNKAHRLGLRVTLSRSWQQWETDLLRDRAGELPPTKLAWLLKRTPSSVRQKLSLMGVSGQMTDGYSQHELAKCMGIHHRLIYSWLRRKMLRLDEHSRIPHDAVRNFLWNHMEEYRFGACNEQWLKTMLNPKAGTIDDRQLEHQAQMERAA